MGSSFFSHFLFIRLITFNSVWSSSSSNNRALIDVVALGTPSHQTLLRLREILFEALIHLSRREHESERVFACVCVCACLRVGARERARARERCFLKRRRHAHSHSHTQTMVARAGVCFIATKQPLRLFQRKSNDIHRRQQQRQRWWCLA